MSEQNKDIVNQAYTNQWRVKSNSREFGGDFAHAWIIRDGKVVEFHEYTDTAACRDAHQRP